MAAPHEPETAHLLSMAMWSRSTGSGKKSRLFGVPLGRSPLNGANLKGIRGTTTTFTRVRSGCEEGLLCGMHPCIASSKFRRSVKDAAPSEHVEKPGGSRAPIPPHLRWLRAPRALPTSKRGESAAVEVGEECFGKLSTFLRSECYKQLRKKKKKKRDKNWPRLLFPKSRNALNAVVEGAIVYLCVEDITHHQTL